MLTEIEKRVIASIQGDMPIVEQPYREIAHAIGIREEELLAVLQSLVDRGIMRRFGATLRHQRSGFDANAMTAWQVDEARIEEVGALMAAFPQVSHCYRRDPKPTWPYNLYTMIHGTSEADCIATAREMAAKAGVSTYELLFSKEELKKTSMTYFPTD
ncbi:MAG: Lrp/AsnC family transcriptional regulator [Desulfosarcinaceae bacterium]|nr:Lrp/AsnC family transcriptional regulator [Desulfosarcinaceae bacterium]